MFNITDGRYRFAFKTHAFGDRGSGEFDAAVERVQVDVRSIAATLAILRHQVPQPVANLGHIVTVIILGICNAVSRPPNKSAVLAVRIRIDGRAAERQARRVPKAEGTDRRIAWFPGSSEVKISPLFGPR